ncbi:MAG: BCCT family transporter [Bilophila wadsworthia]
MESANDPKKFSILGNYDNKIFWPVAILYGCIIAYAIIDPSGAGATFSSIQRFIIAHFSWLILLTGASAIFFSVWMACSSRFATVKLGAADEKRNSLSLHGSPCCFAQPSAQVSSSSGAEPLYHLSTAPTVMDAGSAGTVRGVLEAIRLSVVNWGLSRLAAVRRRWMGYRDAAYRHNKPLRTSTGLYGLLGERCNDTLVSKAVDVLAAIGTIGGVSMMIGLGVASISYAFQILFGIELGATGKFSIMLCFILTYIISTSTGLARGMRYLSESNGYITLGLLFAVLILGATPFTYVINMLMQVAGEFLFRLPQNLLWTDAGNFEPREWSGSWFIFYILWNISYVPFTGGFIARISRGRTMREFVCGAVLVPLFMTLLWFSVWGAIPA